MNSNMINLLNIKDELIKMQDTLWMLSSNDTEVEDNLETIGTDVESAIKVVNRRLAVEETKQQATWTGK